MLLKTHLGWETLWTSFQDILTESGKLLQEREKTRYTRRWTWRSPRAARLDFSQYEETRGSTSGLFPSLFNHVFREGLSRRYVQSSFLVVELWLCSEFLNSNKITKPVLLSETYPLCTTLLLTLFNLCTQWRVGISHSLADSRMEWNWKVLWALAFPLAFGC